LISSLGFSFIAPKGFVSVPEFFKNPDIWRPIKGWQASGRWATLDPLRETYQIIAELYQPGETVVVAPYSLFAVRVAREKLGVPLATVVLEPDKLRSLHRTSLMLRPLVLEDWMPKFAKRLQLDILDRLFIDRFVGPETNAFRAELGLSPARGFLAEWCLSPDRVLAFFPPWYAPLQPDWPAQTRLDTDHLGIVQRR
jgi:rhamnosyltransferase subunit B